MSTSETQDQIRQAKVRAMGSELGEVAYLLWHDVVWLHLKWKEYRELFATDQADIDTMNATAPAFFVHLDRTLWQDILLHLSRLADPPGTGGQQNLTLRRLPRLITDTALRQQVNDALDQVEAKTRFARDWRHRAFAHRDLDHARDRLANPLATASRASVEAALSAIRGLMNLVETHYQGSPVMYDAAVGGTGGARALLSRLRDGRATR